MQINTNSINKAWSPYKPMGVRRIEHRFLSVLFLAEIIADISARNNTREEMYLAI